MTYPPLARILALSILAAMALYALASVLHWGLEKAIGMRKRKRLARTLRGMAERLDAAKSSQMQLVPAPTTGEPQPKQS